MLLDGIPLTSAAGGTVDLSTIPQGLIDHIDVLRGDAAARYGAGALGGVVNVVTKAPGPHQADADLSYGSWNTLSLSASDGASTGVSAGSASGSLALSLFRSDGNFSFLRNLTPDLGSAGQQQQIRQNNQSLSLGALGAGSVSLGGGTLHSALQGAFVDRGLAGTEFDLTPHDHSREGRGVWGVSWTLPHALGPFDLELLGHGRVDSLDVQLLGPGSADQLDLGAGLEATLSGTVGFQRLRLSVSGSDEALEASDGSPSRGTVAASAADRFTFFSERLAIVPAARVEEVGSFFGVSPKLGVSFFPPGLPASLGASPLELRANAGQGFRAPTFGELFLQQGIAQPNPNLSPETNLSADVGASLRWARTLFSVTGFISRYDNLILYEFFPPQQAKPFNEGKSLVEGIEAEVAARPLRSLTLVASYTFLNAFDNDPGSYTYGRPLPFKPAQHAHGRASWQYGRLRASLEADLSTGQTLNNAATLSIPGHSELDAAVGFRLWNRPSVWLTGEARNLLNNQTPDTFGYPLPGLAFFASLQVSEAPDQRKFDSSQGARRHNENSFSRAGFRRSPRSLRKSNPELPHAWPRPSAAPGPAWTLQSDAMNCNACGAACGSAAGLPGSESAASPPAPSPTPTRPASSAEGSWDSAPTPACRPATALIVATLGDGGRPATRWSPSCSEACSPAPSLPGCWTPRTTRST